MLRRLLDDRSVKVRAARFRVWGNSGPNRRAAAAFAAAANEKDRGVRLAAATTILRINGPEDPTAACDSLRASGRAGTLGRSPGCVERRAANQQKDAGAGDQDPHGHDPPADPIVLKGKWSTA